MLVDLSEDNFEEEVLIADVGARAVDLDLARPVLDRDVKAKPHNDVRGGPVSQRAGKGAQKIW